MAPYNVLDNHYVNYAQFKPYEAKDYDAVRLVSAEAQMDFTTFNTNKEFLIDGIKTTVGIISLNPGYQFQAIPDFFTSMGKNRSYNLFKGLEIN